MKTDWGFKKIFAPLAAYKEGVIMTFKDLAYRRFTCRKYTDEAISNEDIEHIKECVQV